MTEPVYCIDSSSLINLVRHYRRKQFPSVWANLENLGSVGRLISPREVMKEVLQRDDELAAWARRHRKVFQRVDADQAEAAKEILAKCEKLIDPMGERPQADPFVIALAKVLNQAVEHSLVPVKCVVVTEEGRSNPNRIPKVCSHFGIDCINLLELFERENWKF